MSTYLIKEGNHYASGLHLGVHFGITEQKYRVKFSKECLYTPDWENDWNKLCGWSYGMHHKNSIRICWRPWLNPVINKYTAIEMCIYVYENGVRKISEFTIILEVEKETDLFLGYDTWDKSIDLQDLNNPIQLINMTYNTKPSCGYRLYPYIGGNNVAVRDSRIELQRL